MEQKMGDFKAGGAIKERKFSCCPVCKNKDLIFVDGTALCSGCSWDSIALSVWAGDYDHIFSQEFTDKGNPTVMAFKECARCGDHYFEEFVTYASCHQCGYFEELSDLADFDLDPSHHYKLFLSSKPIHSKAIADVESGIIKNLVSKSAA